MKLKTLRIQNSGLTLVELAAVITVIGIAVVGLSLGFQNVVFQFQQDSVRNELIHYSNTAAQIIAKELNKADYVERDEFQGSDRIKFFQEDDYLPYMSVYRDKDDGFVFEIDGNPSNALLFPRRGAYRDGNVRKLTFESFRIEENMDPRPNLTSFNKSLWRMIMNYEMVTNATMSGKKLKEEFVFEKSVFLSKKYIELKS